MPQSTAIPDELSHWPLEVGVRQEVIDDIQQQIGVELPEDLVAFFKEFGGGEDTIGPNPSDDSAWIRLLAPEAWIANSDGYGFLQNKLLMFGNDGGPSAFCLSLKTFPMQYRRVDFVEGGQGEYLGSSFIEFLRAFRDNLKLKAPKSTGKPKKVPTAPKDKPLRELKGFPEEVCAMALSPAGDQVVADALRNSVTLFNVQSGKSLPIAPIDPSDFTIHAVGWIGERPVYLKRAQTPEDAPEQGAFRFRIIDALSGNEMCHWFHNELTGSAPKAAFSPDGTLLVFCDSSHSFFIETATGKSVATLPRAVNHAMRVAWSPDSDYFALARVDRVFTTTEDQSGHQDWEVLIVDRQGQHRGQIPADPTNHFSKERPNLKCVHINAAGDKLLTARHDSVRIFSMNGRNPSEKPVAEFRIPLRAIRAACFVGADRLAITTDEGQIVLFDLNSSKPIRKWQTTRLQSRLIAATSDGKLLLTADGLENYDDAPVSKRIRVWQVDV